VLVVCARGAPLNAVMIRLKFVARNQLQRVRRNPRYSAFARFFVRYLRIPLLVLSLAAFLEVYHHNSHWAVRQPKGADIDAPYYRSCQEPAVDQPRANAALVMLVRNREVHDALKTIQSIEKHFNRWFHYPVVFLNDEEWSQEFIETMNRTVSGGARFEVIPKDMWTFPEGIDVKGAKESMASQGRHGVQYAGLETYHHMCRFYSGKFYKLEALKQYKWYWRIEPDVDFSCSITYDPFIEMEKRGQLYGYTIALAEAPNTCPGLFREIADWKEAQGLATTELWKAMLHPSWVPWPFRSWMSWFGHRDRNGDAWNLCHYWSNFEIASMELFRSKEYEALVDRLEKKGGFYFERVRWRLLFSPRPSDRTDMIPTHSGVTRRSTPWQSPPSCRRARCTTSRTLATGMTGTTNALPMPPMARCRVPRRSRAATRGSPRSRAASAAGASATGPGRATTPPTACTGSGSQTPPR